MRLDVRLFGGAADVCGADRVTVSVSDRPTVRDVLAALREQRPAIGFAVPDPATGRLAVNHSFAGPEARIDAGDEVALVTLVSGG